jgi:hypothetical protein
MTFVLLRTMGRWIWTSQVCVTAVGVRVFSSVVESVQILVLGTLLGPLPSAKVPSLHMHLGQPCCPLRVAHPSLFFRRVSCVFEYTPHVDSPPLTHTHSLPQNLTALLISQQ